MGTLVDSLFGVLMSWVRALVNGIWALFTSERMTLLEFLGRNWIAIAAGIVAAGLVIDWLVWLVRWQPYHIWARRVRRLLRIEETEEEETPVRRAYAPPEEAYMPEEPEPEEEEAQWMPLAEPAIGEEEAQQVYAKAESVSDESLGRYPGMRYDSRVTDEPAEEGTRRYAAVHAEGPGAAEVSRRRAEIDAWQKQMQEEARQKAQAERAAREAEAERARRAAYEAEQARLAQEAYEAEQARLAQEAYEAEQARLAQEEYERQLAEYERQKAQYERDLAQYKREKAAYEAAIAAQEAAARSQNMEAAQEMEPTQPMRRAARRRRNPTYSDYVEGESVETLPAPPAWTQMETVKTPAVKESVKPEKRGVLRSGMAKMAQMIEPEHEEISGITALPPRVDMHAAYRPAKKPPKGNEERRG